MDEKTPKTRCSIWSIVSPGSFGYVIFSKLSDLTSHPFSRALGSKGFTLIELLVVIGILALLVIGALVALNPIQKFNATKDASAKSNMDQVVAALNSYFTLNQSFPSTLQALVTSGELKAIPNGPDGLILGNGTTSTYSINGGKTTASLSFTLLAATDSVNFKTWCWTSVTGKTYQPNLGASGSCTAP